MSAQLFRFRPIRQTDREVAKHIWEWAEKVMDATAKEIVALDAIDCAERRKAIAHMTKQLHSDLTLFHEQMKLVRNLARYHVHLSDRSE